MTSKSLLGLCLAAVLWTGTAFGGTLGRVVAIGGQGADLALDEARGVLYIANYTANRVEVMSLSNLTIQTSINVASQPSSLALSADGRYLVVAHYGNFAAPASAGNALTVIDLSTNARQTFALGNPPLGVAFGIDNQALVVTSQEFLLFDPVSGTTQTLDTISGLVAKTLPQPVGNFPPNIVEASVGVSGDGLTIYGFSENLRFRYDVVTKAIYGGLYTASPRLGPRAVSVSHDGKMAGMGWIVSDSNLWTTNQFGNAAGVLNVGSILVDNTRGLIYAQVARSAATGTTGTGTGTTTPSTTQAKPVLEIVDIDSLAVREKIQLPENLAGKAVQSSDGTMYAISDSGVTVLPIANLDKAPRVTSSVEDVVFRGNFCDRRIASQQITILDPGGNNTPFSLTSDTAGVRFSQSAGVTPATITVSVDLATFQNVKGTSSGTITINSTSAVNVPSTVRVLVNNREPDQRGTFVNVPGKLQDLLADPVRDRFYVLRQDQNKLLVFNGSNNAQIASLQTCNTPMSMAFTFDRRYLLVGCDNSHYMRVYDLETLQPDRSIKMETGDYVQSVAASAKAILAVVRDSSGGEPHIHKIDMVTRTSTKLPTLGTFENRVMISTVLTASPNGSTILGASTDGTVYLYDANVDNFTIARKDFDKLSGAFAASAFDQYVVGNYLLNKSLVRMATFESGSGNPSGFAFVDNIGLRTTAASSSGPGIIQRIESATGNGMRATRLVEAPVLASAQNPGFTRTIAPLYSRSSIVNLTTSGFTVLPWSYDESVAPPRLSRIVNAADQRSEVAPGGLITVFGENLGPVNVATREVPLPTALADSCLTVNGLPVPVLFVSPTQINAQLPFQASGNVTMILRTPGGTSDNFNLSILPQAPSVLRTTVAGLDEQVPAIVRNSNRTVVTASNPVHRRDTLVIYLTGLGQTAPAVDAGLPSPQDPLAVPLVAPSVSLGGVNLPVTFAGLTPGEVGVYQINVTVPDNAPEGISVPMEIRQGTSSSVLSVRVVN